jgi:DHA2 family multidrug resistance protein-like MFS transporter
MSTEITSAERPAAIEDLPAERRGWAAAAIFTALAKASLDTAMANIALPPSRLIRKSARPTSSGL